MKKMYLVARTETFAKLFFLLSLSGLVIYAALAFYTFHTAFNNMSKSAKEMDAESIKFGALSRHNPGNLIKYILLWTIPEVKYDLKFKGRQIFIENNCSYQNCYLTTNKELLDKDVSKFNAIVFSISSLIKWKKNMPNKRSPKQKYVFYSMVPADKYPVCNVMADNFFNWTWSYKQYSDIVTPFIEVKDLNSNVVYPKFGMNATDTVETMEYSIEVNHNKSHNNETVIVGKKTKALMWYTEKCYIESSTLSYIKQLMIDMKKHYLIFDVYGCGFNECPKEGCYKVLERDYYFYLAHEGSLADDYVSTEVLKAYHHNAVPVVFGGADYLKYLPRNSYVDASYDSTERVASLIRYAIKTPSTYKNFFAWKNHSTIHATNLQRGYCDLCAMVNDRKKMENVTNYEHFRKWWFYGSLKEVCLPKGAEHYDEIMSYADDGVRREKP